MARIPAKRTKKPDRHYYMVRALGSKPGDFSVYLRKQVAAVGWSDVDFRKFNYDAEALKESLRKEYFAEAAPSIASRRCNEAARFANIAEGDIIVISANTKILLATALGNQIYSLNDKAYDLANQQEVSFITDKAGEIKVIERAELSPELDKALCKRSSIVKELDNFKVELDRLVK